MAVNSALARTIAGFVIAPVVPGALIAAAMLALGEREDAQSVVMTNLIFGYPIAFLFGLPIHALLLRNRWTSWPAYAASGAALGAFLYVTLPLLIEALMLMQGVDAGGHVTFSPSVLPVAIACAAAAAISFWLIVRPDRHRST